jgi:hypothetical protein
MNHFIKKQGIAMLAVLFAFLFSVTTIYAEEDAIELKILHTNDIHAKIDEFGKIAAYIDEERAASDYSLYLDAGDIFSGNPVVDLKYGEPIVDLLNMMNVDAMAIGNHEFDYGQEETVKRIAQSEFPWLSANTHVTEDTLVDFPQPKPFEIFDVNGLEVGVFSLTEAPPGTGPINVEGLEFRDPIETAKQYEYLEEETDILIALTHIGLPEDKRLAENIDFFDVIIGGHSHTTLPEPEIVNGTPIVQTGSDAVHVGNLTIKYDQEADEVIDVEGFLKPVAELETVNEEIEAKVERYNEEVEEELQEVIGVSSTGLLATDLYSQDAPLGNFWTDAMLNHTGADIAFTNNGGVRAEIEAGEITVRDIYTVEPFENEIMIKEMTGAALKNVIEYSYSRRDQVDLQTSGLHYTILTDEEGKYIDAEIEVDGKPIGEGETYLVAVSDFLNSGGSGYHFEGTVIEPLTGKMTEAMINYGKELMEQEGSIDYTPEGRIAVKVIEEDEGVPEEPIEEVDPKEPVVEAEISISDGQVGITDESVINLEDEGNLIINLPANEPALTVNLTEEQLDALVEKKAQIDIVRMNEVTMQFAAETFADAEQLSITLERLDFENPISAVYDFTIKDGETFIDTFSNDVKLIFPVNEDAVENPEKLGLYHLNEKDEWVRYESSYHDGLVIGVTDHFSTFTVLEETEEPEEVNRTDEDDETEDPAADEEDMDQDSDNESDENDETTPTGTPTDRGQNGEKLPSTATNLYNLIAVGISLLITGAVVFYLYRRRAMRA